MRWKEQRSVLRFAMASRGCQRTRTHRAPLPPPQHTSSCHQNKKHCHDILWSPAFWAHHRALLNNNHQVVLLIVSVWACVTETKELQNTVSTFERWSHLATLWRKETTKLHTIIFPEMIPQVLQTFENKFTALKCSFELMYYLASSNNVNQSWRKCWDTG